VQGGESHIGAGVGVVDGQHGVVLDQHLTRVERIAATGAVPPLYLSANIPGGDEHNSGLEAKYEGRIRRGT